MDFTTHINSNSPYFLAFELITAFVVGFIIDTQLPIGVCFSWAQGILKSTFKNCSYSDKNRGIVTGYTIRPHVHSGIQYVFIKSLLKQRANLKNDLPWTIQI